MNKPIEVTDGYARRAAFYRVECNDMSDVPYFLSLIERGKTEVLEVPCGAGRLTAHLAGKAKHVTAIDIEVEMINSLRDYMKIKGLSERVDAHVGDMTDFRLSRLVDLIIVPSAALQLLPKVEGQKAIACFMAHLKPGGRLVMDIDTPVPPAVNAKNAAAPSRGSDIWNLQWKRTLPGGGTLARSVRQICEHDRDVFEFLYEVAETNLPTVTFSEKVTLFHYEQEWFLRTLPEATTDIHFQSSYDNTRNIEGAQRLIVTTCKAVEGA